MAWFEFEKKGESWELHRGEHDLSDKITPDISGSLDFISSKKDNATQIVVMVTEETRKMWWGDQVSKVAHMQVAGEHLSHKETRGFWGDYGLRKIIDFCKELC